MGLLRIEIKQAGYLGKKDVINNINILLKKGELVGIIGPNGAGKSTVIKAIVGLLPEMVGGVHFLGENKNYAYIPEQPVLYEELTLWEHLELVAAVYELERKDFLKKAEQMLSIFRMQEVKHHFPTTFSKGMQQKLMIIIGLLLEPDVYIIDEPFVGLDPRATKEFMGLLKEERMRGAGVLVSTHQLDIAERICDSFILIADGRLITQGTLAGIRAECCLPEASLFDCFDFILEKRA